MFARIHPFSTLGLLFGLMAPLFILLGQWDVAIVLLVLAYAGATLEFKKYTSTFQFILMVVSALSLGIVLDVHHGTSPMLTVALALASMATVARQAFIQQFTYVNLLWVDFGGAVAALVIYLFAVQGLDFSWSLWLAPLPPLAAALFLTGAYVQDARHIKRRTRFGYKVQAGKVAPEFELPDENGVQVKLSDYRGQHPVLLIFVRGDWCPGCHMMLRTYERSRAKFLEKGVHVLGIGPDNISINKDMVQRIGVGFRMLSDDAQTISGQYGVIYDNPVMEMSINYAEGIPLPASFLVDIDGVVRYVSRPDRVGEFLDPSLIFSVLDQLPATGRPAWN